MSEKTTNKLQLENGVSLGEALEYEERYKLTKDDARTVFSGTAERIFCRCDVLGCDIPRCGDQFDIKRDSKGGISIGCVYFSPDQVALVKNWLGE